MILKIIKIFSTFAKIGAFSFGGGLAMLTFIQKEIVYKNGWLTEEQFVDLVAIAQMTPGPIAINSATFCGYKIAGIWGALAGSIGVTIVSFTIITLSAKFIIKNKDKSSMKAIFLGLRPAVLGLIISAAITLGKTAIVDMKGIFIFCIILFLIMKVKIHPIMGIVISAGMGILLY
ncbi:MAG: chromate transporter [Anaeromicrobium sp.]|jgi:chromate transporter|uniref:chromate transporter n=1 Tax=Anaeromicrobium sp. TaxID=1929132 RepID=UPI0025FA402A|nr:chromate transporter [Anaeromicrobium sp.]MCT4595507.1 chromate transporter [Anaeromicrobium sp.]